MKPSSATPIYVQVADELRSRIHAGKWQAGDKLPPEPDFARQFRTSRPTFRKALSVLVRQGLIEQRKGKGTFVSGALDPSARMVRLGIVGLAPENIGKDPYWSRLVHGIHEGLAAHGDFEFVMAPRRDTGLDLRFSLDWKGVFLLPTFVEAMRLAGPGLNAIAHVCLCASVPEFRKYDNVFVDTDNAAAAVAVVDHLAQLGHRNIGHIHAALSHCHPRDRAQGFRAAVEKHGLPADRCPVHEVTSAAVGAISQEIRPFLMRPDRPTAIFAGGFRLALGLLEAAKSLGLTVPGDLSVVGFDDYETGAFVSPPLTTVRQPVHEMGVLAAEMMLQQIDGKPLKSRQRLLQADLVVRGSCQAL